jgi:predicted DNA-binding transcriptional regulator AlpA
VHPTNDSRALHPLPAEGYVRIRQVLQAVPVARSTWWQMVREGRAPKPRKLGPRITAWDVADLRRFLEGQG